MAYPLPHSTDLLTRFLRMLSPFPAEVDVVSEHGEKATVLMADLDDGRIIAYGPQIFMREGTTMTVQLRDPGGGGFDILLTVARCFFQAGDQTLMHLEVSSLDERPGERDLRRAQLSDSASLTVLRSARMHPGHEFQVRLADLSASGVAFLTELPLLPGDVLRVETDLETHPVAADARVVRLDKASFGRSRVGCELIELAPEDRDAISRAADRYDEGTADQRRPEPDDARVRRLAERNALHTRIHARRHADDD
ncbi:MAG TPA: PilZ domain-containing protein [Gaiellales bacterium]|nr:PilZ domain-containing protein [Gaiellales bacterium]